MPMCSRSSRQRYVDLIRVFAICYSFNKQFQCCGYFNSTSPAFVTDVTCPSPAAAALIKGCASPLTSFTNVFVDNIFTAVFGMVGIDVGMIMAIACLIKDRKERERFRYIDEKNGVKGGF